MYFDYWYNAVYSILVSEYPGDKTEQLRRNMLENIQSISSIFSRQLVHSSIYDFDLAHKMILRKF